MNTTTTKEPLSILKLIQHVGEENVQCQSLHQSLSSANSGKNGSTITFFTDKAKAQDLMTHAAIGADLEWVGMVVWMPKNKLP